MKIITNEMSEKCSFSIAMYERFINRDPDI